MKTQAPPLAEADASRPAKVTGNSFNEHDVLYELKHYLPAQAPLKDFIHHNTLHAFQRLKFADALRNASEIFGYKVSLTLDEYRTLHHEQRIRDDILEKIIIDHKGVGSCQDWLEKILYKSYSPSPSPRIGSLRANWKREYQMDLDSLVHPILFRILCSYLDQGISMWNFPVWHKGFLASIREMERNSFTSFFHTRRAQQLLLKGNHQIEHLLKLLVGNDKLYEQYLFDQQFAHQGWSGIVSAIEDQPESLLDPKKISLHDLITFELLLEIDALDYHFGKGAWSPLGNRIKHEPLELFSKVEPTELQEVLFIWQNALEWSYYDQVLAGICTPEKPKQSVTGTRSFQVAFCIDDRECSLRRYLEKLDTACETFATPGFFGVEFYFKPEHGKFHTKLCPAPVTPKYLIKETGSRNRRQKDIHFTKPTHSLFRGWLITHTLGFWSALKLFINIFRPSMSPATASSFRHMDKFATLTIECKNPEHREHGLQVGFTIDEMATRVENVLKSIGLVKDFAPVVYAIGHGSSSVNNPHYAAYDCGACSGRAGSVNARVFCYMANHPKVRDILASRDIVIPVTTQFVGGLHDTTRDEIIFFDEDLLHAKNQALHIDHETLFAQALDLNAKERSRRFASINTRQTPAKIHEKIKTRSVSLFEPRPELNHATNAVCIVGRRTLSQNLFLDRRSFMNSFDYRVDPEGKYLFNILKAAAPVCGGINLEYFFSRVDNQKLGAGTKLPHNVMGLFGVANGIDGDLRPGLPSQMIEVHDPVRLLIIVEHIPEVVLKTIQKSVETYEWFINEWVNLVVINPETKVLSIFKDGVFEPYHPLKKTMETVTDSATLVESYEENIPVYLIS
ncbi:MAG TPA: DUF2309 domain-containing protein [Ohtaekwangia sp.]|uniref:YbcC family protein n=1 Tax=Ohtaekwangia sp. TaxID=2066019 RepID=UPI002F92F350